ncbi:hypothetical protein EI94DRAFT_1811267 [Lactarius quietus]|nr:hypothetical protein EI94DRAFT_1811267 [Lactarius quietus]
MSNPEPHFRGLPQKMELENGEPKGLQQTLEERGFNVAGMRAKCSPQEDFRNQVSLLEQTITDRGHLCMFLPKFHCELNPIEMFQRVPPSFRRSRSAPHLFSAPILHLDTRTHQIIIVQPPVLLRGAEIVGLVAPGRFLDLKLKAVEPYSHDTSRFVFELSDGCAALSPVPSLVVVLASEGVDAPFDKKGNPVVRP